MPICADLIHHDRAKPSSVVKRGVALGEVLTASRRLAAHETA